MSSRPNTSNGAGSSSVPLIKSFRFSSSHDAQHPPLATATSSGKRTSRLQEYLGRSRTASLPPRPHTSSGPAHTHQHVTPTGKGKQPAEDDSQESAASSSIASVSIDPFAAHPSTSAPFVTYSPSIATSFPHPLPPSSRPHTSHAQTATSQAASPVSPSSPQSIANSKPNLQTTSSHPNSSGSNADRTKRRGSILHAASDAFSRMNPIRTRSVGKQPTAGTRVTSPSPIVLTEVIEISESAVRASRLREEEEEERERLRDAAARALGIGDVEAEVSSFHTRSHTEDDYEGNLDAFNGEEFGLQENNHADQVTPVATSPSLVSGLPVVANGNGASSNPPRPAHTRSRSGSFLPMTLSSLQRPTTPKTPSIMSQATSPPPPLPSSASASATVKSHSTPPALTLNTQTRAPSSFLEQRRGPSSHTTSSSAPSGHAHAHTHAHNHERTLPPPKIPPFPTTPALLAPFAKRSLTVPRYHAPSTLLMFALSKQWKNRYFILTSPLPAPATPTSAMSPPLSPTSASSASMISGGSRQSAHHLAPSYLHMFKSAGHDEREVERLEIDDESMAYMADGEVGGRKAVVKFEGILRRRPVHVHRGMPYTNGSGAHTEEGPAGGEEGRTTWIVQITDVEETQKWIEAIKGIVLNQRSIRAGLGASTAGAVEPRGDLDVILSMRAQGFSNTPLSSSHDSTPPMNSTATIRASGSLSPTHSNFTGDGSRSSPTSSLTRSQAAALSAAFNSYAMNSNGNGSTADIETLNGAAGTSAPMRAPSVSATTALKSLFTIGGGARPRSPSTTSLSAHPSSPSLPSDDYDDEAHPTLEGDSFGRAGTSLLSMLRNGSFSSERPMSPTTSIPPTPRVGTPADHSMLDRKILPDSDRHLVENEGIVEPALSRATNGLGLNVGLPRDRDGHIIVPGRVSSDMGSQSLQPPPRKRAGTVSSLTVSTATTETAAYTYSHANGSTAESLGIKNPNLLAPSPQLSSSPSSTRPKDRRARASWSSVSSWASNEHPPSSPDDAKTRRWSRRSSHPYRLSPPYGPPPATPPSSPQSRGVRTPPLRHPYAAEDSLSRSSSLGSSPSPETTSRPLSSKRASGGSVQSFSTASTTQSRTTGIGAISIFNHGPRSRSSHRASMPPPPRPAPNAALPPTPGDENGSAAQSASGSKTSFRDSLARPQRFSLSPPTRPPASGLPPRPDEPGRRPSSAGHRRSSSHGSGTASTSLYPIPASPTRTKSPFPPPNGPLPPTPPSAPPSSPPPPSWSPRPSIARRLRMLSSPPSSPPSNSPPMPPDDSAPSSPPMSILLPPAPIFAPVPSTPIGEPITTLQNDPDFLTMVPPTPPPRTPLPDTPVLAPEGFVPLSPPPRRSSRQVSSQEKADLNDELPPPAVVFVVTSEDGPSPQSDVNDEPAPPPEVDDFASLLSPAPRSPGHCAVSLVDVSI